MTLTQLKKNNQVKKHTQDEYLDIHDMEGSIIIDELIWPFSVDGECSNLYIRIRNWIYFQYSYFLNILRCICHILVSRIKGQGNIIPCRHWRHDGVAGEQSIAAVHLRKSIKNITLKKQK